MFELSLYFFDNCSILISMYSYVKRNEGKVMEHYLDNSATTKVSQKAAEKAFEIMTENYGNPSSLHLRGMYAEQELVKARKEVARSLVQLPTKSISQAAVQRRITLQFSVLPRLKTQRKADCCVCR